MYWCLVSRGVVSGLCLVAAKFWYDTREEKAACRDGMAQLASDHTAHLPAAAFAIEGQETPSASSAAAVAETTALSGDRTDARAKLFQWGDIYPATAEAVPGEATDNATPDSQAPSTAVIPEPHRYPTREKGDDDQRVDEALASGDLISMDTLLEDICDPVLRNLLLNRLVTGYYRLRSDSKHRAAFYRVADLQIDEATSILDGIEEIGKPRPDHIEAFKSMAIALDEDGRQDSAIAVCELALSLGLQDGTKTGFEGRINRLKKSQMRFGAEYPEKLIH